MKNVYFKNKSILSITEEQFIKLIDLIRKHITIAHIVTSDNKEIVINTNEIIYIK